MTWFKKEFVSLEGNLNFANFYITFLSRLILI